MTAGKAGLKLALPALFCQTTNTKPNLYLGSYYRRSKEDNSP
ncbi:MAG: hypothetical protein OT643_09375 [Bacteroidetes bacterium]|nr:hypothetical protein [Bacteroidota bacterium]